MIFIIDIWQIIAENVKPRLDTSNYELDRPLPKRENKKVIGLMKDEWMWKGHGKICWIKSKNL